MIQIIRNEDEPKPVLMQEFKLSDVQAEAILNMRLRNLRRLEEMEIRTEHTTLTKEQGALRGLVKSEDKQWAAIADEIRAVRKTFGPETKLGKRRTTFAEAPVHAEEDIELAMIEREPITVIVSEKGWIRALKGHAPDTADLAFKTDDQLKVAFHAETTDEIVVASTGGRFYTLQADKLPGGRGHGEPIKLMVDMDAAEDIVGVFVHKAGRKLLVVSTEGRGFVVPEDDVLANTRKGKRVMAVSAGRRCASASRRPATPSRSSARTASSSSSRSTRSRRWARQGRAPAAIQGRRRRRRPRLRQGRRPDLGQLVGPDVQPADGGAQGMGRRARPGRPRPAGRVPALEPVRDGDRDLTAAADGGRLAGSPFGIGLILAVPALAAAARRLRPVEESRPGTGRRHRAGRARAQQRVRARPGGCPGQTDRRPEDRRRPGDRSRSAGMPEATSRASATAT